MKIISSISEMQAAAEQFRAGKKSVGFVPTMGYLHEGHLSLVRAARAASDVVVMSIFVNPTQFGPSEDFERYPRDIDQDTRLASESGTDIIFLPATDEMYPHGFDTFISVGAMSKVLEGQFRPNHFRGVTTVVCKLFHIVKPHTAYFGQKDAQQVIVIRSMVADLNFDLKIIVLPTVRESDGLAKSSRNVYLSPAERMQAPLIYRSLQSAESVIRQGERNAAVITNGIRTMITSIPGVKIDYISIADTKDLTEAAVLRPGSSVVIAIAVRIGTTRLIDNIPVTIDEVV